LTVVEQRIRVGRGVVLAVRRYHPDPDPDTNDDPDARAGGVPVLLVHGLASNARIWDGVAAHLAAAGHPVAAVDQRGHGQSDKPDTGYDFATVTADLAAVIDALGWAGGTGGGGASPPLVAGQSWGGNVVLELAIRHPDAARAVACIDGGTIEIRGIFPTWETARAAMTPPRLAGLRASVLESMLRSAHPDWPETGIAGALANFEVRPDGTVAPWLTLDRHMAIVAELWHHHPSQRYPLARRPVLLVPTTIPVDGAEAALPCCRVRPFEGADHDVHAQHPAELAALLHDATGAGFFG